MKYHKTRNCPECAKELLYSCNASYNLAKRRNAKCRNCSTLKYANKQNDLSILLEDTPETYYWMGFILADGHIEKGTRLAIRLSIKDRTHLQNLAEYLKIKNISIIKNEQCSISPMDSIIVRKLSEKFDIKSNKTINPPLLNIKDQNLLFALSIGFIDGDGCIDNQTNRKDVKLRVKCHSSWQETLNYIFKVPVKINNQGYAYFNITNSIVLRNMKLKAINLNLPYMNRKWDKIDINFIGKQEKGKINTKQVKSLLSQGIRKGVIAKRLNLCNSAISNIIKRNNL